MHNKPVTRVVIVGGGTAGWMTAIALSSLYSKEQVSVHLIESDDISTVGVGEATIPEIALFNDLVGIDENDFLRFTGGTFKLGIEFVNWGNIGEQYMHPFGASGIQLDSLQFYHHWQRLFLANKNTNINDYSICMHAAKAGKFKQPSTNPKSPLSGLSYAYHFDAIKYAKFLRGIAEQRGVKRTEGLVDKVNMRASDGYIESLVLNGSKQHDSLNKKALITGDLFIDCTGFRGLLIKEAMQIGFDDWSHLLPCDNAVTIATANTEEPIPYTRATAHAAGWQWRIPLQHRVGNGHVYSSKFMSEDEATAILLKNIKGIPLNAPRNIKFTTGMRQKFWHKNCVAIGLSCGFMEPLESTSIHLIQASIFKLMDLFPAGDISNGGINEVEINKYNQLLTASFTSIRDFLILHYHATQRDDSPFWRYCKNMDIPTSLQEKIALYQSSGRIYRDSNELFTDDGWLSVMHGQGLRAGNNHPAANNRPLSVVKKQLQSIETVIKKTVERMPSHAEYIAQHCAATGL